MSDTREKIIHNTLVFWITLQALDIASSTKVRDIAEHCDRYYEKRRMDYLTIMKLMHTLQKLKIRFYKTYCIDCSVETKPGAGSARCPDCWDDRCGARGEHEND
mgnify:CR=1 FL=1